MAIKHIPKKYNYVGRSTDDKSAVSTEGATVYYTDTGVSKVYHDGVWYDDLTNTSKNKVEASLGMLGSEVITDTAQHTGDFYWITVIEEAIIGAISLDATETGNSIIGVTLPVGFSNPLLCESITLTSGSVKMKKISETASQYATFIPSGSTGFLTSEGDLFKTKEV